MISGRLHDRFRTLSDKLKSEKKEEDFDRTQFLTELSELEELIKKRVAPLEIYTPSHRDALGLGDALVPASNPDGLRHHGEKANEQLALFDEYGDTDVALYEDEMTPRHRRVSGILHPRNSRHLAEEDHPHKWVESLADQQVCFNCFFAFNGTQKII